MSFAITSSPRFAKDIKSLSKRYASILDDLERLAAEMHDNPHVGKDLGGGLRKVRLGIKSKNSGKRGGGRVITLDCIVDDGELVLLTAYDKADRASVSRPELKAMVKEYRAYKDNQ